MAKVLLVEDDNNLREIYQARLMAEGYEIVAAQNGEEALAVAKQSKPDLIISDVMMPRISGFEMLDILRNSEELKTTKVIMLTALGQNEDQQRASGLGADKYLVKSQVTLEDIVNAAKELLGEGSGVSDVPPAPAMPDPIAATPPATDPVAATPDPAPAATDSAATSAPATSADVPMATPPEPAADAAPLISMPVSPVMTVPADPAAADPAAASNDQTLAAAVEQLNNASDPAPAADPVATTPAFTPDPAPAPAPIVAPSDPNNVEPAGAINSDSVNIAGKKIIQPLDGTSDKPNLDDLLAKEGPTPELAPEPTGVVVSNHQDPSMPPQPDFAAVAATTPAPAPEMPTPAAPPAPIFAPAAPAIPAVEHIQPAPMSEPTPAAQPAADAPAAPPLPTPPTPPSTPETTAVPVATSATDVPAAATDAAPAAPAAPPTPPAAPAAAEGFDPNKAL